MAIIRGSRNAVSGSTRKGFSFEGLAEVKAALKGLLSEQVGKEIKDVAYEAGRIIADQIRANAPYDPKRKKGTHLRDAVFVSRGRDDKPNVLVGVSHKKAPHAWLVEYGSSRTPAQPYIRPALSSTGPQAAETLKTGLLDIIAKRSNK